LAVLIYLFFQAVTLPPRSGFGQYTSSRALPIQSQGPDAINRLASIVISSMCERQTEYAEPLRLLLQQRMDEFWSNEQVRALYQSISASALQHNM
jgi:hypothetical protein